MSTSRREGVGSPLAVAAALRRAVDARSPQPTSEARHALLAYDLIFPELVMYRGGWFRASRLSPDNANTWFEKLDGDIKSVESMVNHLDVFEDYPSGGENADVAEAVALVEVLRYSWPIWAQTMYGVDIQCRVSFWEDVGEEPEPSTITFWSKSTV